MRFNTVKFVRSIILIIGPMMLAACWDLGSFELDEAEFDQPFDGNYFSVSDEFGPIGVYGRDGNWFVPQHRVDPSEKSQPQKTFEVSRFAIVFIDKFAPPPNRFALSSAPAWRQYSHKFSSDHDKRLAILVGQEPTSSGSGGQYIVPVLIHGAAISRCTGDGVFSTSVSGPGYGDYANLVDALFDKAISAEARTHAIFEAAIQNMMSAVEEGWIECGEDIYQVEEILNDEVRTAVAKIVPAKEARVADRAARDAEFAARQAEAKRARLAKLEADGVQIRLEDLSGYFHVSKVGVARFDPAEYRGGVRAYTLNVVRGHANATARNGRMGRVQFFPDTQQYEYQAYAATRNGSCAEYTDPNWSARFEFSERDAPGVWYEGLQYAPSRQSNPNACMAYDVAIGSCRRVRCLLRARNQPDIGPVAVVRDAEKASALYDHLRSN